MISEKGWAQSVDWDCGGGGTINSLQHRAFSADIQRPCWPVGKQVPDPKLITLWNGGRCPSNSSGSLGTVLYTCHELLNSAVEILRGYHSVSMDGNNVQHGPGRQVVSISRSHYKKISYYFCQRIWRNYVRGERDFKCERSLQNRPLLQNGCQLHKSTFENLLRSNRERISQRFHYQGSY